MKRRLLAVLLAAVLVLMLVPAAMAEENGNSDESVGSVSSVESSENQENTTTDPEQGAETPSDPEQGTDTPADSEQNPGDSSDPAAPAENQPADPTLPSTPDIPEIPDSPNTPETPEIPEDQPEQKPEENPAKELTEEELESYYQQCKSNPDTGVTDELTEAQWEQLKAYIEKRDAEEAAKQQPVTSAKPVGRDGHIDSCLEGCTGVDCDCPCHQDLYGRIMACETLEEIWEILDEATDEELEALTEEEYNQIDAFIVDLIEQDIAAKKAHEEKIAEVHPDTTEDSEIIYPTVNVDDVAPLGAPVVGGAE